MKSRLLRGLLFALPLLVLSTALQAQERTTIRDLISVPDDVLAALQDAGAALDQATMDSLLTDHIDTESEFTVTVVVLTDPLDSGLASWDNDRGGPGRVHVYVRDTTAASAGNAGMSIQLVDGAYEDNGTLDLIPGDVIEVTGLLSFFTNSVQVTPNSLVVLGDLASLGLPATLADPDTVTTSDLNTSVGDGVYQANWTNYNNVNGGYVCVIDATVFRRTVTGAREDWAVTSDAGASVVDTYDMSLSYRNDRDGAYTAPFNVLEEPFVPPAIGASVDVCGTVVHQPGNDPFATDSPAGAKLSLVPWAATDLTVKASPPQFAAPLTTPEVIVAPEESYFPVADITFDPERTPAGVTLYYTVADADGNVGGDTVMVAMTNTEGTSWTAEIPGLGTDRAFAIYWATAEDNTGAVSTSSPATYRVFSTAISSISDIQQAAIPGANNEWPSPLTGIEFSDLNLTGTVQTQPDVSGFVAIQDDPDLGPWSGIVLDIAPDGISQGDELVIASASVREQFGVTQLTNIVLGEATGKIHDALPYKEVDSAVLTDAVAAEQHEGMLVSIPNARIVTLENFGEWTFSNGTDEEAILGDDASAATLPPFNPGEVYEFLRGMWWFSFGTYKIVPEDENDFGPVADAVERIGDVPGEFTLHQNYPNPFNPSTMITYDLPSTGHVTLQVFDVSGRLVSTLVDQELSAGAYQVSFDAGDLASGLYVYRLQAGSEVRTSKMLLMR